MKNFYQIIVLTAIATLLSSCALFEGEKKEAPQKEDRFAFLKKDKPIPPAKPHPVIPLPLLLNAESVHLHRNPSNHQKNCQLTAN